MFQAPHLDVESTSLYITWLYNRATSLKVLIPENRHVRFLTSGWPDNTELVHFYSFADKVQDPGLKSDIVDLMIEKFEQIPRYLPSMLSVEAGYLCRQSNDRSIPNLFAEFYARRAKLGVIVSFASSQASAFIEVVLASLVDHRLGGFPEIIDRCKFHIHPDGVCRGTKRKRTDE